MWKHGGPLGYAVLAVVAALAEAIALFLYIALISEHGIGLVSFWPELIASFAGGVYAIYVLQEK